MTERCVSWSRTDRMKDEVGCKSEDEAAQDAPGRHVFVSELARDGEKLDDDIQDRSRRQREERGKDRLVLKGLTDDGSDERRTARDQPERAEKTPTREMRLTREGSDDAEALGRVVQRESDDEHEGQTQLPSGGGLADRQTFREVVEADPQRDEEREPFRWPETGDRTGAKLANVRRPRAETHCGAGPPREPQVVVDEAHQPEAQRHCKDDREPSEVQPGAPTRHRLPECRLDRRDALGEDVPEEEEEDSRRAGIEERAHVSRRVSHPAEG